MNMVHVEEAGYQLKKTLTLEREELGSVHPWVWETDRWKELVFSLLTKTTKISDTEVRLVTERLLELDLIKVPQLAAVSLVSGIDKESDPTIRHVFELLVEGGFTIEEAERGVTVIVEAAVGLHKHYKDKVQLYIRHFGELMLNEIDHTFKFTALTPEEVADAFTYWMQNVLNMPLSLVDEPVQRYAAMFGVTSAELITAADEIDMNLVLVDDLAQQCMDPANTTSSDD